MATLHAHLTDIVMVLRPYRAMSDDPEWLLTQFEFRKASAGLVSTTISVTRDDLQRLRDALDDVVTGRRTGATVVTTDEDFIFDVSANGPPGIASVGFWQGEPATLMKGYRFMVLSEHLRDFMSEIDADERAIGV